MKIKVKKFVEVNEVITVPDIICEGEEHFDDVIKYILSLEFVATSCSHIDIGSHFGFNQGGSNTIDIVEIGLVDSHYDKKTFKLSWRRTESTYLIAREVES